MKARGLCALAIAGALAACLYVPTPEHSSMAEGGAPRSGISRESIARITVGKTTRADVLLNFGRPTERLEDDRYFAYHWATVQGYLVVAVAPGAGFMGAIPNHYVLLVEFDRNGSVRRFATLESGYSFESIKKNQDDWIAGGGKE